MSKKIRSEAEEEACDTLNMQTLRTINTTLSVLFRLDSVPRMLGQRMAKEPAVERVRECMEDLRDFVTPLKVAYEDEHRVAFIDCNSTCRMVPIPDGYARKRSGTIKPGDMYYREATYGFEPCEDSHTFLYVSAANIKLVVTPEPAA